MKFLRILLTLFAVVLMGGAAFAQTVTVMTPSGSTSLNTGGTIVAGGTYQQVFPLGTNTGGNNPRKGCTIQNNSSHVQYIFAGPIANATHATSAQLAAGSVYYCVTSGSTVVVQDQISIDGTTGDSFYAASQQ